MKGIDVVFNLAKSHGQAPGTSALKNDVGVALRIALAAPGGGRQTAGLYRHHRQL